jgi:hypothetical protein
MNGLCVSWHELGRSNEADDCRVTLVKMQRCLGICSVAYDLSYRNAALPPKNAALPRQRCIFPPSKTDSPAGHSYNYYSVEVIVPVCHEAALGRYTSAKTPTAASCFCGPTAKKNRSASRPCLRPVGCFQRICLATHKTKKRVSPSRFKELGYPSQRLRFQSQCCEGVSGRTE